MTLNIPLRWHHFFHRQEKIRRFRRNSQWNDLNPVLCLSFFLLFFLYIYVSNTWGYWVCLLPYFNDLDANEAAESSISKVYSSSSEKESRLAFVTNNADSWWGCFKRAAWNIDEPFVSWKFSLGENLFVYRCLICKKKKCFPVSWDGRTKLTK